MDAPKEIATLGNKLFTRNVLVRTPEEVEELLHSNSLFHSITFAADAAQDISKVARIISKNRKTLRHLTLDRHHSNIPAIHQDKTKEFGIAVGICQELVSLQIKNFHNLFNEAIGYLIAGVISLPNLECLNLSETYLYPHLDLLVTGLSRLRKLQILNLERCGILCGLEFSVLSLLMHDSDSLRELNLGSSPIWLNGFVALLQAFSTAKNNLVKLIWSPPSTYQECEIINYRLMMAVNWQEHPDVKAICLANIAALSSGKHDTDNDNNFKLAVQKLNELQDILEQRRNPKKITKLQFTITDSIIDTPMMLATILSCISTLEELEITAQCQIEKKGEFSETNFPLARLLEKATHLHTFKLVNFKNLLAKHPTILVALASLPNLRILVLRETYLGEAGSKIVMTILMRKILTELDVTNSGLVNDICFKYLTDGLQQCDSLRRLALGQSPMTGIWLKMLVDYAKARQSTEIFWQPSNFRAVSQFYEDMCKDMRTADQSLKISTLVSSFMSQNLDDLQKQTTALISLQNRGSVISISSYRRSFFTGESDFENPVMRSGVKNYGTAATPKSPQPGK